MLTSTLPAEAAAGSGVRIIINNQQVAIPAGDQQAFVLNGRTYVPLRVISENLGARVKWDPKTRQVIIATTGSLDTVHRPLPGLQNEVQIVVNGKIADIPAGYGKPFITAKGRTVVPLRLVGETLGCKVNWQGNSGTVEISSDIVSFIPIPGSDDKKPGKDDSNLNSLLNQLARYRTNLRLLDGTVINSEELLNRDPSSFSSEQIEQFQKFSALLSRYDTEVVLPGGTVWETAGITIQGEAVATADQLRAWLASETPRIRKKMEQLNREFIPIPDLAELYIRIGAQYGIRGDLAFCQAAKETHYWQFTGSVQPFQNNYCGLWATGAPLTGEESYNGADPAAVSFIPGVHGAVFASPEIGVEAHIQHLYAYATDKPLPPGKVLYDPRFNLVARGSAPTWQGLNGRWAVPGITYGQSIIHDYWVKALQFSSSLK
ncbi:hypothetical protein JOC37_002600 [Desulfohalotomaculum tongense]|uniref:stalk domain-containing protein n=1 Tax=Desulforadius tongensis TaxID=1216062 RepID=UPI001EE59169|nr:stalk domain-containing protein [Desulforadius tongensis]MBM7856167.1 hypothetical protein [Desulforadius tongensis]